MDRTQCAVRLNQIQAELSGLYRELGEIRKAERQGWSDAYRGSAETSASGRDSEARMNVTSLKVDSIHIESQVKTLEGERDHLRFVVKYGLEAGLTLNPA